MDEASRQNAISPVDSGFDQYSFPPYLPDSITQNNALQLPRAIGPSASEDTTMSLLPSNRQEPTRTSTQMPYNSGASTREASRQIAIYPADSGFYQYSIPPLPPGSFIHNNPLPLTPVSTDFVHTASSTHYYGSPSIDSSNEAAGFHTCLEPTCTQQPEESKKKTKKHWFNKLNPFTSSKKPSRGDISPSVAPVHRYSPNNTVPPPPVAPPPSVPPVPQRYDDSMENEYSYIAMEFFDRKAVAMLLPFEAANCLHRVIELDCFQAHQRLHLQASGQKGWLHTSEFLEKYKGVDFSPPIHKDWPKAACGPISLHVGFYPVPKPGAVERITLEVLSHLNMRQLGTLEEFSEGHMRDASTQDFGIEIGDRHYRMKDHEFGVSDLVLLLQEKQMVEAEMQRLRLELEKKDASIAYLEQQVEILTDSMSDTPSTSRYRCAKLRKPVPIESASDASSDEPESSLTDDHDRQSITSGSIKTNDDYYIGIEELSS